MYLYIINLLLMINYILCAEISMKIIDGQSMHGIQNTVDVGPSETKLKMRFEPSDFHGPNHFRLLLGECFNKLDGEYNYILCPFQNVTQFEKTMRWNPYSGVLGSWDGWEIKQNMFTAMLFKDGDSCGSVFRSVRVIMKCGANNRISRVSEPKTCQYELDFETPLVCHNHSRLVYPTLSEKLRNQWNEIEGLMQGNEITEQGYRKRLREIFEEAGYQFKPRSNQKVIEENMDEKIDKEGNGDLSSLVKCADAYHMLKKENESLRHLIRLASHEASKPVSTTPHS